MVVDSKVIARKRARWQGRANVDRFAEQLERGHSAQRLKDNTEVGIVRRFMCGERILDVGIGTGRVSLPLLADGIRLTGVDASAAMIQRCGSDARATSVRLVKGELENLPFAHEAFDTVLSVDTLTHFRDWKRNLDELIRVTSVGGRIIVDVGSRDHVDTVARSRGCTSNEVQADELDSADAYTLRLSIDELRAYAAERGVTLVALVPSGAILGSLVPNYWTSSSYASRSGAIDRLVSWIGADPLLFAFAEFIERRIVQELPPAVSGRMFVVLQRDVCARTYVEPLATAPAFSDERGADVWLAEFTAYVQHPPNRAFAVAFYLAASRVRLPDALRSVLPGLLLRELEVTERATHIDEICVDVVAAWRAAAMDVVFHGVDLSDAFGTLLASELRDRLAASQ